MHVRFYVNVAFLIVRSTEYNNYTTEWIHWRDVGDIPKSDLLSLQTLDIEFDTGVRENLPSQTLFDLQRR